MSVGQTVDIMTGDMEYNGGRMAVVVDCLLELKIKMA